jgi:hypothetical protein
MDLAKLIVWFLRFQNTISEAQFCGLIYSNHDAICVHRNDDHQLLDS